MGERHQPAGRAGLRPAPDAQGQGLGAEAAQAVLALGFDELGLHRITATCIAGNERSARLLTRLGMRQEAHHVHSILFKGGWKDQLGFALLEGEWRAPPPPPTGAGA